jgi:hypothetical protein
MTQTNQLLQYLYSLRSPLAGRTIKTRSVEHEVKEETQLTHAPKKSIYKQEFDIYKIESLVQSKLVDEFKDSSIDIDRLISCIRKLYYTSKGIEGVNKNSPYISVRFYIGNNLSEFINKIYKISDISFKSISSRVLNVLIETDIEEKNIKKIDFLDFYNQGLICSYILNKYYSYNIEDINCIFVIKNLKKVLNFTKKYDENKCLEFFENSNKFKDIIDLESIPDTLNSNDGQCSLCTYETICRTQQLKNILNDNKSVFKF